MTFSFATDEFTVSKTLNSLPSRYLLLAEMKAALPCLPHLPEQAQAEGESFARFTESALLLDTEMSTCPHQWSHSVSRLIQQKKCVHSAKWGSNFISTNIVCDFYHCITVSLKFHGLSFKLSVVPYDSFCCYLCSCSWDTAFWLLCWESQSYRDSCFSCLVSLCCLRTSAFENVSSVCCNLPKVTAGHGESWCLRETVATAGDTALKTQRTQWLQVAHNSDELILRSKSETRQLVQRLQLTEHAGPPSPPACWSCLSTSEGTKKRALFTQSLMEQLFDSICFLFFKTASFL